MVAHDGCFASVRARTPDESRPPHDIPPAAITGTWLYFSRKRKEEEEEEDRAGRLNASRQPMHANAYLTGLRALSFAISEPADSRIHSRSNATGTLNFLAVSERICVVFHKFDGKRYHDERNLSRLYFRGINYALNPETLAEEKGDDRADDL